MSSHLFYFVRHGQSILNEKHIRQDSHGQLSERGVEQAHITGERIAEDVAKNGAINIILCSPYDRTRETASILNDHIKVQTPIIYNDILAERRNPSEIIGQSTENQDVKKIVDMIDNSFHGDVYRYSDEENFLDLKDRAKKCLDWLTTRREKRILVVTHGIFLKMLMSYMIKGEDLTSQDYNKFSFYNPSNNAGVTVVQYDGGFLSGLFGGVGFFAENATERWKTLVWDDHYDIRGKNTTI